MLTDCPLVRWVIVVLENINCADDAGNVAEKSLTI